MELCITTLSENTSARQGLLAEAGISFLVEADGLNILMDTGQSVSAVHNAGVMGIDLDGIDKIVLSHGHYDHTGGLPEVLSRMSKEVEVIAHPDIWTAKYAHHPGAGYSYIGVPLQRSEFESLGARFNLSREPVRITDRIMTTGEVPMVTEFEQIDSGLLVRDGNTFKPDDLLDDRALVINAEPGLVVVLGCAHRGIINTLYHAMELTGVRDIYMVLGGCHLISATEERIWLTIAAMKELGVRRIGVSHCTGLAAAAVMAQEFGDSFFFNNTGNRIEIP